MTNRKRLESFLAYDSPSSSKRRLESIAYPKRKHIFTSKPADSLDLTPETNQLVSSASPRDFLTVHLGALCKDQRWPLKARVWACLSLHVLQVSGETVCKLRYGQIVPVTRGDIAAELDVSPLQVRRELVILEREGWLERRATAGRGLRKNEIEIHLFATPRLKPVPAVA
jgi:hypothetical protein